MSSGFDPNDPSMALDPHPTDILRLHLAIGVIEKLNGLASGARKEYIDDLENLSQLCAQGNDSVQIQGRIEIERDRWLPVNLSRPLADMQEAAREVGNYLATAKLTALGKHGIQEIETWDDPDENTAQQIATALQGGTPITDMGDDAQLLAGSTLALLADPNRYDAVTKSLVTALDSSYAHDPIWGDPRPDRTFIRTKLFTKGSPEMSRFELVLEPVSQVEAAGAARGKPREGKKPVRKKVH
jgi:hypothetical protein